MTAYKHRRLRKKCSFRVFLHLNSLYVSVYYKTAMLSKYTHTHTQMCVCIHLYVCAHIYRLCITCTHVYVVHIYIPYTCLGWCHMYACIYIYICIHLWHHHICMYTCTTVFTCKLLIHNHHHFDGEGQIKYTNENFT